MSENARYFQVRLGARICLRSEYLHSSTCYSVCRRVCHFSVSPSLNTGSNGIFTVSSIGFALRLILRTRLTLIRLTLIRNPWSFGEEVSRLLYRYLYLHLLFQTLQHFSRNIFCAFGMLPYQYLIFHSFGIGLHARLLSTQRHSTSELLRTL